MGLHPSLGYSSPITSVDVNPQSRMSITVIMNTDHTPSVISKMDISMILNPVDDGDDDGSGVEPMEVDSQALAISSSDAKSQSNSAPVSSQWQSPAVYALTATENQQPRITALDNTQADARLPRSWAQNLSNHPLAGQDDNSRIEVYQEYASELEVIQRQIQQPNSNRLATEPVQQMNTQFPLSPRMNPSQHNGRIAQVCRNYRRQQALLPQEHSGTRLVRRSPRRNVRISSVSPHQPNHSVLRQDAHSSWSIPAYRNTGESHPYQAPVINVEPRRQHSNRPLTAEEVDWILHHRFHRGMTFTQMLPIFCKEFPGHFSAELIEQIRSSGHYRDGGPPTPPLSITPHSNRPYTTEQVDWIRYHRVDRPKDFKTILCLFWEEFPDRCNRGVTEQTLSSRHYRDNYVPQTDENGQPTFDEKGKLVQCRAKVRDRTTPEGLELDIPAKLVDKHPHRLITYRSWKSAVMEEDFKRAKQILAGNDPQDLHGKRAEWRRLLKQVEHLR